MLNKVGKGGTSKKILSRKPEPVEDVDPDYGDDHIPDTNEIKKKVTESAQITLRYFLILQLL